MVDYRLYSVVCGFAMVDTLDSAWYCRWRHDSSGNDKNIQTYDLVALLLFRGKAMKYLEKIIHSCVLFTALIVMLEQPAAWAAKPVNADTQGSFAGISLSADM